MMFGAVLPQVSTGQVNQETTDLRTLDEDPAYRLVVVDGQVSAQLSSLAGLPEGVFTGSLHDAPDQATADNLVGRLCFMLCVHWAQGVLFPV